MTAARLQAVFFDMDGLLVSSEETWYDTEIEVMDRLGGPWGPEHQKALLGGPLPQTARYMLDVAGSDVPPDRVQEWLLAGMERRLRTGPVRWMPGARELLVAVSGAGVPCALVSASHRRLVDAVLDGIGQPEHRYFAVSVGGDEVERTKPHPDPYLAAARRLGADPRRCVVLEDSPPGVASGEAAGCVVVGVPSISPIPPAEGRTVVASLQELDLPRLEALVASRLAA